jgi:hypothetical protein
MTTTTVQERKTVLLLNSVPADHTRQPSPRHSNTARGRHTLAVWPRVARPPLAPPRRSFPASTGPKASAGRLCSSTQGVRLRVPPARAASRVPPQEPRRVRQGRGRVPAPPCGWGWGVGRAALRGGRQGHGDRKAAPASAAPASAAPASASPASAAPASASPASAAGTRSRPPLRGGRQGRVQEPRCGEAADSTRAAGRRPAGAARRPAERVERQPADAPVETPARRGAAACGPARGSGQPGRQTARLKTGSGGSRRDADTCREGRSTHNSASH